MSRWGERAKAVLPPCVTLKKIIEIGIVIKYLLARAHVFERFYYRYVNHGR